MSMLIPIVSAVDRAKAYIYIRRLRYYYSDHTFITKIKRTIDKLKGKSSSTKKSFEKRTFTLKEYEALYNVYSCELDEFYRVGEIRSFIEKCINQYPHVAYLRYTEFIDHDSLLCFIVDPPQITFRELNGSITPDAYINIHFFTMKFNDNSRHKTIITKFFLARNYARFTHYIHTVLDAYPVLKNVYNRTFKKELQKTGDKKIAHKRARRDVIRVFIGNTWLVQAYVLIELDIVKKIDYPIKLLSNEHTLINPIEIIPKQNAQKFYDMFKIDLNVVTWEWLRKKIKQAQ